MTKQTLVSLTAEYNALMVQSGGRPIKLFTCSRADAEARVAKARKIAGGVKPKRDRTNTIKALALSLLKADKATAEIVDAVKARFPASAFDSKHVYWYRAQVQSGRLSV